jgi:hypothetical protein
MRSPLQIDAEKTLLKKLSIGEHGLACLQDNLSSGALAVLGGGAFAYMAGPGLLVIGKYWHQCQYPCLTQRSWG